MFSTKLFLFIFSVGMFAALDSNFSFNGSLPNTSLENVSPIFNNSINGSFESDLIEEDFNLIIWDAKNKIVDADIEIFGGNKIGSEKSLSSNSVKNILVKLIFIEILKCMTL